MTISSHCQGSPRALKGTLQLRVQGLSFKSYRISLVSLLLLKHRQSAEFQVCTLFYIYIQQEKTSSEYLL